MAPTEPASPLAAPIDDVVRTAIGRAHRDDAVRGRSGGPAGNARLTAWLGIVLLALFLVECVTLISLHQMVDLHIILGTLLVPVVAAKTAVTGWRILRYYTGDPDYVAAGPPPLLLRLLGPLVVFTGFAVLGSGLALVALGPASTYAPLVTFAGQSINALTVHQAMFVAWLVVVGLHTLTRAIPAVRLAGGHTVGSRVPGGAVRLALVALTLAAGVGAGLITDHYAGAWSDGGFGHFRFDDGDHH